ncbi:hypothetical protein [Actinomadura madurae]|uniref:hypothetical protein n=1 Tax=Actinomadura madurae TaxID=1993 RepID=UPI0020D256AA|nr:hypothetical protein [Actinomadura madurae]MCP9947179.1 hypothetical protein [Actinomadura madurae]MCP9963945.1 hypothetical protein [Actinomadura madurae]MCP9976419.1 hypothetical protein [Actinomadura madurae]MCQ0012088.1 hypothetical protein [Actinomadura madurae]MCQ0012612.1 hypothetical protein [Actinomadura madurae]
MTIQTTTSAALELLALRTEYAVRTRDGEHDTVVPVGDEALMRQTVAELLDQGQHAEPVYRTVTAWQVDETASERIHREIAREHLLSIAQTAWEQVGDKVDLIVEGTPRPVALAALRDLLAEPLAETAQHSTLGDVHRLDKLVELLSELTHQEQVEDDEIAPGPSEDKQTLLEDAERRVTEAADALYGGAAS